MKHILLSLVALLGITTSVDAQIGVQRYGNGCTFVKRVPLPDMSLAVTPRLGSIITWRWDNTPNQSRVCPNGPGVVLIGVGRLNQPLPQLNPPGNCRLYVNFDGVFVNVQVPLCPGRHAQPWIRIPNIPALVGFKFNAQTFGWISRNILRCNAPLCWWSTNGIEITIQR